jgi:4-oxalocrotonate tautomerase
MPLVRISLMHGKPREFRQTLSDIVHKAMVETMNVPSQDRFQIITEHTQDTLIYDPSYLDIHRSDDIIIIQVTLNEGRTTEVKRAFYKRVVELATEILHTRPEDVMISLVEVKKENWSFGNGIAQYAPQ